MLIESSFQTPIGFLNVTFDEHFIYRAFFTDQVHKPNSGVLAQSIAEELGHYFQNPHHRFQLQLKPQGSAYQLKVWNALLVIPVGRTITYGDLANTLQTSPRAIGQACRSNPLALFIPCHRVVGKNDPGGYMGKQQALTYKNFLLSHEGV